MADQESQPPRAPSRAEQRMAAVAKLRRAASLPRMKDGRRPPMHVEAVSEGEKPPSDEDRVESEEDKADTAVEQLKGLELELTMDPGHGSQEPFIDPLPAFVLQTTPDNEVDAENPDTELEERAMSPGPTKKRRSRSRSRSRGSKDFKGKLKLASSPMPQLAGDSSQDETLPMPSPMLLPISPIPSPVPHLPFLQPPRLLRSPTPLSPDISMFYPGPSPPTPLPTLEDLQKGLMRSNSVGAAAAAGRRLAMHKLTGGTESYDPSPSPTPPTPPPPPVFLSKLSRNNTVAGGERIAARENMLNRIGTRMTREADAEVASGVDDRGPSSPTPKRRRRRSRNNKGSAINVNVNPGVSDSDIPSTDTNTPAIPSSPLAPQDQLAEVRARSATPIHPTKEEQERPEQHRRRSVVIEDPDDDDQNDSPSIPQYPALPGTPHRIAQSLEAFRMHGSRTPSNTSSSDSAPNSAVAVPLFYNPRAASRNEQFPTSPFTTPLKERPLSDDDEQVLYPAAVRPRTPWTAFETPEREISWVASPVPEFRMPIRDDEEEAELNDDTNHRSHSGRVLEPEIPEEEEDEEIPPSSSAESPHIFSPEIYNDMSPRVSASSKSVLVESSSLLSVAPSSTTTLSQTSAVLRIEETASPQIYPQRLSVASPVQSVGDRSTIGTEYADLDNYASMDSPKRETSTATAWEKVKNTLVRAGSSSGRRSRTNSILTRERRDNTDSSVSRESGGSLPINRIDSGPSIQTQAPPLMQAPSASASILSLSPPAPPRLNASPIPPASSADLSKYQNAKLFPFPGIVKLKEERLAKGHPYPTPSTPDVSHYDEIHSPSMAYSFSGSSTQTIDPGEQKLYQQSSDTRRMSPVPEPIVAQPSFQEYIDLLPLSQNGSSYNLKLPMTLPGVKQWLSKNSRKKGSQTNIAGPVIVSTVPGVDTGSPMTNKRPSLSDIFTKRPNEPTDWEDQPATPDTNKYIGSGNTLNGINHLYDPNHSSSIQPPLAFDSPPSREASYKYPSPPSRLATATPDPSSVSDYPAPTPSESSITSSSSSLHGRQGSLVLERLEENLSHSRSPMWSAAVDDPPRKLVLSSPVLQVVNQNTVKDRFLLLFTDILVVAKPVTSDPHDSLTDPFKLTMPDKKYTVKHVILLQKLRFCDDRIEGLKSSGLGLHNPLIRSFVSEFAVDPDNAVAYLFAKSQREADAASLGQLLFKTLDLDRSRLGEYLARRSSKSVLKSYLDSFGFAGLRVDVALRVFLLSINLSQYTHSHGALEYVLDAFASRWYEANAKFVPYDKDMALQLAWALAQLNDRLFGAIADEPGITDPSLRPVSIREFQDAFRRYDPRCLISDDLLQELYHSISYERLCQAGPSVMSSREIPVVIKRPIPSRLTYKAQSEPIVFRLPQPDPFLTIELYGQDLIFDPPILHFVRSSEASFRVTGTSLGVKTITMCRSGPNAIKYSGLPLSHSIIVERAFMRNTFQAAFLTSTGVKRRYMFSVDDPIIRNEWITCLRRQIDSSNTAAAALRSASSFSSSKFHRAAQSIAFEVLQEKLMGTGAALFRSSLTNGINGNLFPPLIGSSAPFSITPIHTRSKSRSRIYNLGAGKDENELNRAENSSNDSNDSGNANLQEPQSDGNVWTSRDLEMYCLQNSSISLVLSFLQVGAPAS